MTTGFQKVHPPGPAPAAPSLSARSGVLQRKCACGGTPGPTGECEECRKNPLQRKPKTPELGTQSNLLAPPIVHEVLGSVGQPLDAATCAFMEPRFGHDFSHVRVHTDAKAAESARSVAARAYTVGSDIVFQSDRYAPESVSGRQLLAHELTHVIQQRSPASSGPLTVGPADDACEQQAEAIGRASLDTLPLAGAGVAPHSRGGPVLQRDTDSSDYAKGYEDGLSGVDPNPAVRDGDALIDYNEGYAKGHDQRTASNSMDYEKGYEDALSGIDPYPALRDGDALTDYNTGYARGKSEFNQRRSSKASPEALASEQPPICTPPSSCPAEFCTPMLWATAELSRLNTFHVILAGIGTAVSPRVIPLWNEFIWGGNSTVQDLSAQFADDFRLDPATSRATTFILDALKNDLRANPPVFPPGENTVGIDIAPRIARAAKAIATPNDPNQLSFSGNSVPGNLAGGIGRNQAACPSGATPSQQEDDRRVEGTAKITRFPHIGTLLVQLSMNYTVDDTIDFCPGNCGAGFLTLKATTLLSRWEATGISGDVPFTVKFPAPLPDQFSVELAPASPGGQGN